MALELSEFAGREDASVAAAAVCAGALADAIAARGTASLMVSGGSTPTRMFELLSDARIDWARVTAGLVDERWVAPDDPDSNERLVRRHLLQRRAAAAGFLPMWAPAATPEEALEGRDAAYRAHCRPLTVAVLGMGLDGHTASWFPGLPGLAELVAPDQDRCVAAVRAAGAIIPQRMTLTGGALMTAARAVLLVFGAEKRSMLLRSASLDPMTCPVRFAIDGLGDRLSIFWAP
ncbi:MAG: 6-phosphogluconolactonase [Acidobacteria bacterium]|nr:6-phosphogluconolactonase [Acidobacteriota bacterium]